MTLDTPSQLQLEEDKGDHGRGQMALAKDFVNRKRDGAEPSKNLGSGLFYL